LWDGSDDDEFEPLGQFAVGFPPAAPPGDVGTVVGHPVPGAGGDDGGSSEDFDDLPAVSVYTRPPPPTPLVLIADAGPIADNAAAALTRRLVALSERYDELGLPDNVQGVSVKKELRVVPQTGSRQYARLHIKCPWHGGRACNVSRTLTFSEHFGLAEPFGYVGAWLLAGSPGALHHDSAVDHSRYKPDLAAVSAFLDHRGMLPS
jgi:hypothetical protein